MVAVAQREQLLPGHRNSAGGGRGNETNIRTHAIGGEHGERGHEHDAKSSSHCLSRPNRRWTRRTQRSRIPHRDCFENDTAGGFLGPPAVVIHYEFLKSNFNRYLCALSPS
jgi:hypothetical protein